MDPTSPTVPPSASLRPAPDPDLVAAREQRAEAIVRTFTRLGTAPRPTFPLALVSVTVAVLAMHIDLVAKYSLAAFWVGLGAALLLAIGVGHVMSIIPTSRLRMAAALGLPTLGGAVVGVIVQAVVLQAVTADGGVQAIKDLGGLVDSTEPVSWLLGGIVLGAVPALAVSLFLLLAARALRALVGNDAAEGFHVAFTGGAGLLAALALVIVEPWELPPLVVVTVIAGFSVLLAFLVDGARLAFLREVWAGIIGGGSGTARSTYEVVPADRFLHDPSLAPLVAQASAAHVLVRVDRRVGSYRAAAAEPIALLADTELETTRPLRRRRLAATAVLFGMVAAGGLSLLSHQDSFGRRLADAIEGVDLR